jgi:hypothetical protein
MGDGSPYLSSPARTLYDACHEAGRDRNNQACPDCPVRTICDADRRRHGALSGRAGAVKSRRPDWA